MRFTCIVLTCFSCLRMTSERGRSNNASALRPISRQRTPEQSGSIQASEEERQQTSTFLPARTRRNSFLIWGEAGRETTSLGSIGYPGTLFFPLRNARNSPGSQRNEFHPGENLVPLPVAKRASIDYNNYMVLERPIRKIMDNYIAQAHRLHTSRVHDRTNH
jgi:hypothetical protein